MQSPRNLDGQHTYNDPTLAAVVTMAEVMVMYGVSRTKCYTAILSGKFEARRAATGGSSPWLITTKSVLAAWGIPPYFPLPELRMKDGNDNE